MKTTTLRTSIMLAAGIAAAVAIGWLNGEMGLQAMDADAAGGASQAPAMSMAEACSALSSLTLTNTTITMAQSVPAGPLTLGGAAGRRGGGAATVLPAFCRVAGTIRPSADSNILFEVWMPMEGWNQRFQAVGNGGLAGSIDYQAMAGALGTGYATAGTDTGHQGATMAGEWALNHPEKIKDFGNRAVHEMTVQSKAVIGVFYRANAQYSYWNGCSEGGGQALSEAQRYPADYDGILAGAPANYLVHLQAGGNWISQAIHKDPATFISPEKLPLISKTVLDACDANDGVKDGVLEDPRACHVNLDTLLCKNGDAPDCLTAPQLDGLKKIYAGAKNPRTGAMVFPGQMPGGEDGWGMWIAGTDVPPRNAQHGISVAFFKNFVFSNPNWDWTSLDLDKDVADADQKIGKDVNHINPDLSAFKGRGGKLLQYHGWNDPAISPLNSVNYFTSVQQQMGNTTDFYRLFMMPGMGHCNGGPGPNQFDRMAVISAWVEKGIAPDQIVASRPGRTRPICPYPKIARYNGSGSTDEAANFACALPN